MEPHRRREVEAALGALARRQHGVVTRHQLLALGLSGDAVDRRLSGGRLRRMHRGVFAVGPIVLPRAREMAATLACGPTAVVSHRSAARLWEIVPGSPRPERVDVVLRSGNRRPRGVQVRRIRTVLPEETTALDGIPVTTAARTLLDLASVCRPRALERALAEGVALGHTTEPEVRTLVERHHRRRGTARLLAVLDQGPPARTRSEAEETFLALVRRSRLPEPQSDVRVAGHTVDFLWPSERLVVEVDGRAFHRSGRAFESDRRRDADLAAAGLRVMRVAWRQITREPEALLVRLAGALVARAHGSGWLRSYSNPS